MSRDEKLKGVLEELAETQHKRIELVTANSFPIVSPSMNLNETLLYEHVRQKQVKIYSRTKNIPKYQTTGSSGVDVQADLETPLTIAAKSQAIIPTGLHVAIPEGYEIQLRPRSGLAAKNMITIRNSPGTIDHDYLGEIKIILVNDGNDSFVVNPGDRIAQMILCPVIKMQFVEVNSVEELGSTVRGQGGFGSTKIK